MAKRSYLTKAARGYSTADAANTMVRNLLSILSVQLGGVTEEDMKRAIAYFGFKCPYTGKPLPFKSFENITSDEFKKFKAQFEIDHIIPQNKSFCGLNLPGNLIYVLKAANHRRSDTTFEDFILNNDEVEGLKGVSLLTRKKRVAKIKKFQKDMGYSKYLNSMSALSNRLDVSYKSFQDEQIECGKDLLKLVKI